MLVRYLVLLATATVLTAQTAPEPARIAGTVTNSLTGEPILRAHVTVRCTSSGGQQRDQAFGALTNEKGEFSIAPLPAAQCSVNPERVGFVASQTASFTLSSGARKEAVKLTLTPTGAITGRVINSAGDPVEGISVMVETLGNTAMDTTDDKGQFRIGGLRPGKYRVRAHPQQMAFPPEIRTDGTIEQHDTLTYYPDTVDAKTAPRVEVKAGAEMSGVDIKLVRIPSVKVSGTVIGIPAGMKGVMVNATPSGNNVNVKADGTFTIWQLSPGQNTLRAQYWGGPSQLMSAPVDVEIGGNNIDHVELRMVPAFEVSGVLAFDDEQAREVPKPPARRDGTPGPAPEIHRQVQLLPLEGENVQMGNPTMGADDTFKFEHVQPARYRVMVTGTSGFVKSVRAGSTEVEGDVLEARNGPPGPVTVTLSSNYCEITGSVSDSNGPLTDATVMLVPVEWRGQTRTARSDSGTYKFRVPPGKYKLAIVDESTVTWGMHGPDLDDSNTETVEVSAGDKLTKDLVQRQQ